MDEKHQSAKRKESSDHFRLNHLSPLFNHFPFSPAFPKGKKMKNKYLSTLLLSFLLVSCDSKEAIEARDQKAFQPAVDKTVYGYDSRTELCFAKLQHSFRTFTYVPCSDEVKRFGKIE